MKKIINFFIIFICVMLVNIGHIFAKTEIEVETDCEKGSTCVISNDTFSFEIKSVDLYDNQNKKLETIKDFTIDPKAYKADESDLKTTEITDVNMQVLFLNMDIPNLKDTVKKYQNNVFIGYIVISYKIDIDLDGYKYTYKNSALDTSTKLKNETFPSTGQYKQFFVTLDKDDNFYMDDYFYQRDEDFTSSGSLTLIYFLSNNDVSDSSINLFDEDNFVFFIANNEENEDATTIEDDGQDFATYYERNSQTDNDADIIDTQESDEEIPKEKSGESVPPTSVSGIAIILVLIVLSALLFMYANKKIFKSKI